MSPAHNGKSAAPGVKPQRECGLTGVTNRLTRYGVTLTAPKTPVSTPNRLAFKARSFGVGTGGQGRRNAPPVQRQAARKRVL